MSTHTRPDDGPVVGNATSDRFAELVEMVKSLTNGEIILVGRIISWLEWFETAECGGANCNDCDGWQDTCPCACHMNSEQRDIMTLAFGEKSD